MESVVTSSNKTNQLHFKSAGPRIGRLIKFTLGYLRYLDFVSIVSFVMLAFTKRTLPWDRVVHSPYGLIFCRKHTNDLKFTNLFYERELKQFLLSHIDTFNTFVDVGACIGEYSVWLAGLGKQCIAIEPAPTNFSSLTKNIVLNSAENKITSHNLGISSTTGTASIQFQQVNTGSTSLTQTAANEDSTFSVDLVSLDSLLESYSESDTSLAIKVDVEGMELEVLAGMKDSLSRFSQLILILETTNISSAEILDVLNTNTQRFQSFPVDSDNAAFIKQ